MKDIMFTSAGVTEIKLESEKQDDWSEGGQFPKVKDVNFRFQGRVTIDFVSSGDFQGMTYDQVSEIVLGKLLSLGLLKP